MPKTEFIRARVDENLKANVDVLFKKMGITMTEAITIFLKQCELNQGLPFEVKVPNEQTKKVVGDAMKGKGLYKFNNLDEMFEELEKN